MNLDKITYLYKNAYFKLPNSVQMFLGSIYGNIPLNIRFGKYYEIHKKIAENFNNFTIQQQEDYIYNKTYETINFANENIPYYKNLFNDYGISLQDLKSLSDFKRIPNLNKKIIQNNLEDLYTSSKQIPISQLTGGSTFTPTKFYLPLESSRGKEKAYTNYIFGKLGYKHRDKCIQMRDRNIVNKNDIYWEYEKVENHLIISANHIEEKYIEAIIGEINKFSPKFFYGYPSSISRFVKIAKRKRMKLKKQIKGVFLISENALPSDINTIKSYFQCDVLSHYGHSERCSLAYSINNQGFNFLNSYGMSRIVNNEIVTTSFDNFVMPFINYQTQDYVNGNMSFFQNTDVCKNVQYIEGRMQEFVVNKNKELVSMVQFPYGSYDKYDSVEAIQFFQNKIGYLTLRIQSSNKDKVQQEVLLKELREFTNNLFIIDIQFVDKLEKTKRGKCMYCIQKLNIESFINA